MPLPSTRVVHKDWSEHHYPVTEGAMTGEAQIWRPGTGAPVWDEATQTEIPPTPTLIWEGKCRIQALNRQASGIDVVGQTVVQADYLIACPWNIPAIQPGSGEDWIVVTKAWDDSQLPGRRLRIVNTAYGTLRWERDIWVMDDMTNQPEEAA